MGSRSCRFRRASRDLHLHSAKLRRPQIQSCPILVRAAATRSTSSLSQRLSHTGNILSSGGETGTGWTNCPPRAAPQCGPACVSSTVTAQSVLPALRANSPAPFTATSIPIWRNGSYSIRPMKTDSRAHRHRWSHCRARVQFHPATGSRMGIGNRGR